MKENLAVYEALRNEILRVQDLRTNCSISMYVSFIALFSIGFSFIWIFLASFIVLIIFQAMINRQWWLMTKQSVYIRVFFENQRDDMHWENFNIFKEYLDLSSEQDKELSWIIHRWSTAFLSVISLIALFVATFVQKGSNIAGVEIAILVCACILCILAIYTNKQYFKKSDDTRLMKCTANYFKQETEKKATANNHLIETTMAGYERRTYMINVGVSEKDLTDEERLILLESKIYEREYFIKEQNRELDLAIKDFERLRDIENMPVEAIGILNEWFSS